MSVARPQLGYVLPAYQSGSTAHYAHIPRLLEHLAEWMDIEVVIWDCRDEPTLPGVKQIHRLAAVGKAARWLELRRLLARRVGAGCKRWFVRGSSMLAWAAELSGAETIYWSCGVNLPPVGWRDRLGKALARLALHSATRVATAPGLEGYYEQQWGVPLNRLVLLDNDIDLRRFQPADDAGRAQTRRRYGLEPDRLMILFVHRLCQARGADYLLPVLEACAAAGQRVTLLAVGPEGDVSDSLQSYAARRPEQLVLTGALANAALPELYAAADVFVLPSRGEGFPRVLLEAMACRTAVVTAAVGVAPAVVPAQCHALAVSPVGDVDDLAQKVVSLLADPAARAALAQTLYERVQHYDTPRVAERYARVLSAERFAE